MTDLLPQLGFFVEKVRAEPSAGEARDQAAGLPWVALPRSGMSRLSLTPDSPPRLLPDDTHEDGDNLLVLETIRHEYQSYLMMISAGHPGLRVNAQPAGPISILRTGDQVQVAADYVLHVSAFHSPSVGPPEESEIGSECLVCRTPIQAGRTIYRCAVCGAALHNDGPERQERDRLECAAAISECPRCRESLVREAGYTYLPEV